MKLDTILDALKDKEIDQGIIDAVKALDQSAEVERLQADLESEQGKAKGILEDKRKYKERAEKSEADLKAIEDAKLPEKERQAKALEEMQKKLDDQKAQAEADKADFARVQREAKLSDLTASIKWADGTPTDTAKLIISNAMTEVDLSDQGKVDEVLKLVKENHKSFIAADAPAGSGGKGSDVQKSGSGDTSSIADNQKEIWGN